MSRVTEVFITKNDLGKKVYRKVTRYTIDVEQDVVADSVDEAEEKFLKGGGIEYDEIKSSITSEFEGVETYSVDCNYLEGEEAKAIATVAYDPDDEYAEEDGFVEAIAI